MKKGGGRGCIGNLRPIFNIANIQRVEKEEKKRFCDVK